VKRWELFCKGYLKKPIMFFNVFFCLIGFGSVSGRSQIGARQGEGRNPTRNPSIS